MDNQGEQGLSQDQLEDLVPDLMSAKGQSRVESLLGKAQGVQPKLDAKFRTIAWENGLNPGDDYESRVKDPNTAVRKVAQHRQEGKSGYRLDNVNDLYGGRFIANTPDQKEAIIKAVKKLDENHDIKIDKEEQVDHGTYHAYHIDFNKDGVKGEVQIHDPHSFFEAVINHDIRSKYGEKPPAPLDKVKERTSQIGYGLPGDTAQKIAQQVQQQRKMKAPSSLLNAKPIFNKEDRSTIGNFAQSVEEGRDKGNLGQTGQDIQRIAENLFGREAANWSNKKIKNALDLYMQQNQGR